VALAEPSRRQRVIAAGPLTIEVGPQLETCLVRVEGELDLAGVPMLERELEELLSSDLQSVILDLEELEFIDSLGLRCLLEAARGSRANGDRLRMLRPTGQVARILKLTGVGEVLPLIAD
jgi:anti-sigma B factor antagonist